MPDAIATSLDGGPEDAYAVTHVALHAISKRFGGIHALRGVDLSIRRGSVHALVGENGAGKSTLGRVIAGAVQPDRGEIRVSGRPVVFRSPRDALAVGITGIAQELALLPARSVLDNVFLGVESHGRLGRVDVAQMEERYDALAERVGLRIPPNRLVGDLRIADQQKLEILRALARDAELVVLDEPTAALTTDETRVLLATVRRLADAGTTVVFVSHFLREVLAVSDVVTILKDGAHVRTAPAVEESEDSLVTGMLGRSLERMFPRLPGRPVSAPVALAVEDLTTATGVAAVSLHVRAGEVVGIAGLVGSGRSELLHAVHGGAGMLAGTVRIDGRVVRIRSPRDGQRAGIALLPENRKEQGLLMARSMRDNITLAQLPLVSRCGVLRRSAERAVTRAIAEQLSLDPQRIDSAVGTLSGGNQQKVLFARCLLLRPRVLLADEPTRGVDVGAKHMIYALLAALAADGMAILFASSEIEEVLELSHRALVMRQGRIAAELTGDAMTEDAVMHAAFATEPTRGGTS